MNIYQELGCRWLLGKILTGRSFHRAHDFISYGPRVYFIWPMSTFGLFETVVGHNIFIASSIFVACIGYERGLFSIWQGLLII